MATDNILVQVQTYNRSNLGLLQNTSPFLSISNKKFKDFNRITANLGSTVLFDLPPRFVATRSLVISFQAAGQRQLNLTVDQAASVGYAFTAQEEIFNVDKDTDSYMAVFGKSAVAELGAITEGTLALNCNSSVPVYDANSVPTGALHTESGPYRFYGNGVTPINSYTQLAQMIANYCDYGAVTSPRELKVVLPITQVPGIIGQGLGQFAPKRNDEIAETWELGEFGGVEYYASNLLPKQVAGFIGDTAAPNNVLTVVSTNDPTGANITAITFSTTAGNGTAGLRAGDLIQFNDGVSGQPNLRYLTFTGHFTSNQPVQIRVLNTANVTGGQITVNITPALQSTFGPTQNLNNNIVAGMQATPTPSHQCGIVIGGDAFFLGMPKLPAVTPFPSSSEYDAATGASLRTYYGAQVFQNQYGIAHDLVFGSVMVPEYTMRMIFPLS